MHFNLHGGARRAGISFCFKTWTWANQGIKRGQRFRRLSETKNHLKSCISPNALITFPLPFIRVIKNARTYCEGQNRVPGFYYPLRYGTDSTKFIHCYDSEKFIGCTTRYMAFISSLNTKFPMNKSILMEFYTTCMRFISTRISSMLSFNTQLAETTHCIK